MRMKNFLLIFFLGMFLITLAVAQSNSANVNDTAELQQFYSSVKCATDFYSGVIGSMNSFTPSNLSSYPGPYSSGSSNYSNSLNFSLAKLQGDLGQIQTYANSGDRNSLRQYVQNNFESDHSMIKSSISNWRTANVRGLTPSQRSNLLSQYNQLKTSYDTCYMSSLVALANARVASFENELSSYQNQINSLSAKGIDVSSLNQVISAATTQLITPFQNATNSANDSASLKQVISGYCLFDGCANGINFHLAAKFEVAKLQIAVDKINSNSNNISQDKEAQVTQLQADVTDASSVLAQVGTNAYTSAQNTQLWNDINVAYNLIRSILSAKPNPNLNNTATNTTAQ